MKLARLFWIPLTVTLGIASVFACSKDDDAHDPHSSPYPSCDAIIKACHTVDLGEGKPSECHGMAHDAPDDSTCAAKKDECLRACAEAAEAGVSGDEDGGAH